MSYYNINDMCRVCLVPTASRRNSNLFFSSGRSVQLWAKVMACAWVQVFEGDGLPSQICYKCHNKLDIAYQFKQQCEAADAQIRQFLNRTVTGKGPPNNIDLTQTQPECLAECKPLNFNITSECLDLAQSDLSLSAYRLMSQDISLSQQIDFRLRDDFATMKQEPGLIASLNLFNPLPLSKGDCQMNSSFKCESFNDNDIMLDNLPTKLFESVNDTIHHNTSEAVDQIDCKMSVWDLQHKEQTPPANKSDFVLNREKEISQIKQKDNIRSVCENEDLSFLADDRSASPIMKKTVDASYIMQGPTDSLSNNLQGHSDYLNKGDKDVFDKNSQIIEETVTALKVSYPEEMKTITKRSRKKINKENQDVIKTKAPKKPTAKKENSQKKEDQKQCELCGKVFKYRSYMALHLQTHSGEKPYGCSQCDRKFTMYRTLVTHLRTHSGDRPYVCAVCGKAFTQSTGLKSHMRAHTGEQPFECEICGKNFSQKSNLLIHKQIHSGRREHICTVCNVAFKFYKHLQSHMKLHSDQKEFKCSVCEKSFHRKRYLRIHLSTHSGERPYRCDECGHTFTDSSNLRAHLRIHSGIKPYKCKVCKKTFIQSGGLNRHMQQHSFPQPTTDSCKKVIQNNNNKAESSNTIDIFPLLPFEIVLGLVAGAK